MSDQQDNYDGYSPSRKKGIWLFLGILFILIGGASMYLIYFGATAPAVVLQYLGSLLEIMSLHRAAAIYLSGALLVAGLIFIFRFVTFKVPFYVNHEGIELANTGLIPWDCIYDLKCSKPVFKIRKVKILLLDTTFLDNNRVSFLTKAAIKRQFSANTTVHSNMEWIELNKWASYYCDAMESNDAANDLFAGETEDYGQGKPKAPSNRPFVNRRVNGFEITVSGGALTENEANLGLDLAMMVGRTVVNELAAGNYRQAFSICIGARPILGETFYGMVSTHEKIYGWSGIDPYGTPCDKAQHDLSYYREKLEFERGPEVCHYEYHLTSGRKVTGLVLNFTLYVSRREALFDGTSYRADLNEWL